LRVSERFRIERSRSGKRALQPLWLSPYPDCAERTRIADIADSNAEEYLPQLRCWSLDHSSDVTLLQLRQSVQIYKTTRHIAQKPLATFGLIRPTAWNV
jgi:hypothetical protein